MSTWQRYEDITRNWSDDSRCSCNRERVWFHYFNPNGLGAQKRAMNQTISQYVDAGIIPSGWILAYGTFSNYAGDLLQDMVELQRVNRISLRTALDMMQDNIDNGYTKLGEFILS